MLNYDVVIPCAQKDYIKIPYCIDSLVNLSPTPSGIYVVSKDKVRLSGVTWIDEKTAIPINSSDINYRRPNWIYQQILKMTQDFTINNYLCIDSDLIINKELKIFDKQGRPNYFISSQKQNHKPYFNFMDKVWNLKKLVDFSFISDITFFNKSILKEFIPSSEWLLEKCNKFLSEDCLIGEPEIYGNYITGTYGRNSYNTVDIKVAMYGKYMPDLYDSVEIEKIIDKEKNTSNNIIAMHSWT